MKVKLQVKFEIEQECPDDWDFGKIKFHFEENYCISNLIVAEAEIANVETEQGVCSICNTASVKVIGLKK